MNWHTLAAPLIPIGLGIVAWGIFRLAHAVAEFASTFEQIIRHED